MLTPTELTAIGGLVLSAVALVVLPLWFRRQAAKQLREQEERVARQLREQEERQEIKDAAKREAAAAEGTTVSWEKVHQAVVTSAKEERLAHTQSLMEMREAFAEQLDLTRRRAEADLDRAKGEIDRLGSMVKDLEQRVAHLNTPAGGS